MRDRTRLSRRHGGGPVELLREIADDVHRSTLTHLETPWTDRTWCGPSQLIPGAGGSLAGGTSVELLKLTPPGRHAWRLSELGFCVQDDRFDNASVRGVHFTVKVGDAAYPGLTEIAFPFGSLSQRGRVYVVGHPGETLTIEATNEHATDVLNVNAAIVGFFYSTTEGHA